MRNSQIRKSIAGKKTMEGSEGIDCEKSGKKTMEGSEGIDCEKS